MPVRNKIIKEDLIAITKSGLDWQRFNNKTVLITGANGFLPAYMVETLLYLNDTIKSFNVHVLAFVRNKDKARKRFSDYLDDSHLEFLEQDVSNEIRIDQNVHFIIHAASQASPKYFGVDPVGTLKANILGTLNLMKLAVEKQIESFLYFSSGEVYGETSIGLPVSEEDYGYLNPLNVRSCYGESKRMGENICVSYHHQHAVPAKIVRPFHTYGPGMLLDDGRVYADFISDILHKRDIIMKSDGSAIRTFCYVADAAEGFFTVLLNGSSGNAYNVANPREEYSILDLANKLSEIYRESGLKVVEIERTGTYLKSSISRNAANISRIQELGWFPVTNIEEGFTRTIESYSGKVY